MALVVFEKTQEEKKRQAKEALAKLSARIPSLMTNASCRCGGSPLGPPLPRPHRRRGRGKRGGRGGPGGRDTPHHDPLLCARHVRGEPGIAKGSDEVEFDTSAVGLPHCGQGCCLHLQISGQVCGSMGRLTLAGAAFLCTWRHEVVFFRGH